MAAGLVVGLHTASPASDLSSARFVTEWSFDTGG